MTQPQHILDFAIEQGHHTRTPREFARKVRKRMKSLPSTVITDETAFSELEEGQTYIAHNSSGHRGAYQFHKYRVMTIQRITPKATQAVVYDEFLDEEKRIYEGKERGTTFYENDGRTAQLASKEHREIVEYAILTGHEIPPRVRRHHPGLFVRIPERWEEKRIRKMLTGLDPTTAESLRESLEHQREKLRDRETLYTEKVDEGREEHVLELCLGFIEKTLNRIELYEWLLPHVEDDGPFALDEEPKELGVL